MIPGIEEHLASYATLHQATVSLQEMGERTISTQVKIDGSVVPDFDGWYLMFKGEKFVLPIKEPQAAKDNTTLNSLVDLSFVSWPVLELKRYFFFQTAATQAGVAIPDQYNASVVMPVEAFVTLFNSVLSYYFGTKIHMDLYQMGEDVYSTTPVAIEINYTYIWDVLTKFNELFDLRWRIEYEQATDSYAIKVNYPAAQIDDHDFEYGYKGGLLRFERQVQDDSVTNILLGRGGENNLPYRYFKKVDPNNDSFAADPDAIPELASIYFDRLRDVNFRWYVRGWMQNANCNQAYAPYPFYHENDVPEAYKFAFLKGKYQDTTFSPVEYVKDDESIARYGERWGAVESMDDVYPTIQGMPLDDSWNLADEVVAVSEILTDDIDAAARAAVEERFIGGRKSVTKDIIKFGTETETFEGEPFEIPSGKTGNVELVGYFALVGENSMSTVHIDTTSISLKLKNVTTGVLVDFGSGIPAGTYKYVITLTALNNSAQDRSVTFGIDNVRLTLSDEDIDAWKPTFDIWVKNIWGTERLPGENNIQYSERVWAPILGDRVGNEAKVAFSTGAMSISEDYDFVIAEYPVPDQTRSIVVEDEEGNYHTVQSEWRITLRKSDAEFDATGMYIPNAQTGGSPLAGDHFYFLGIDMPFLYVIKAEERLNAKKQEKLDETSVINPTWVIALDKVRVNTLEDGEYGQTLAERLSAGCKVTTKDKRFTRGSVLTLYVQSITYNWNEGSSYPDIEVILSDKVVAVSNPVSMLSNEVDVIKTTYVKSSDLESTIRKVTAPIYLKKTGESDTSNSPTKFASAVSSKNFRSGDFGGDGWGFYEEAPVATQPQAQTRDATPPAATDEKGSSVLEIDKLVVRKELYVNSIAANQITYIGGKQIISAASIECTQVIETPTNYICYFDQKSGSVGNLFKIGDIAMGQTFDAKNQEVRYYRAVVDSIGVDFISLSKTDKDGQGVPAAKDIIVQYGSKTDPSRQYVIIRDVIGGGYERMLSGLDDVDSNGKEYFFAGTGKSVETQFVGLKDNTGAKLLDDNTAWLGYTQRVATPRWFVGDKDGDYAEWLNGELVVKGRLSVRKGDGSFQSIGYLADAFPLLGSTLIDGGLILSSRMQLGQTVEVSGSEVFNIWSGMNGVIDSNLVNPLKSIAAWYGGPMVDHEASPSAQSYAKSLFRMDGSGYLAGTRIKWDENGYGEIPGVEWGYDQTEDEDYVLLKGSVRLQNLSGDSVAELIQKVSHISSLLELVQPAQGSAYVHIKNNYGLVVDGFGVFGGTV